MKISVLSRILLIAGVLVVLSATARTNVMPLLMLRQAQQCRADKEHSQAIDLYADLIALRPDWADPHIALGEIYVAQGRWDEAENEFRMARNLDGQAVRALSGLADVAYHQGDAQRAIQLWHRTVALGRGHTEAHYKLAEAYLASSDVATAEQELQRLVLHESDHQGAHYLLGLILAPEQRSLAAEHLGLAAGGAEPTMANRAQEMLDILTEMDPGQDGTNQSARLADAYLRYEVPGLALEQLDQLLRLQPDNHTARAYAGYALWSLGRHDLARQVLREVTLQEPKNPLGYYFLALLHRSEGYVPTALWEFKRALSLDPYNAAAYAEIAATYQGLGQYIAAEEWYRGAVDVAPQEAEFRFLMARFYVEIVPKADEGLAAAKETAALIPEDAVVQDLLGWAHYLAGDLLDAKIALERALELDPTLARAYYHLGVVCMRLGDQETSSWAYWRAVDLDAEGTYRARALQALSSAG
jgi:tetratricopeptide (TPR) repeat protein